MKNRTLLMVPVAAALMLSSGFALGQDRPADCPKPGTPAMVEGQVTRVDMDQGKLSMRASDGTMHEFQASKETLGDYKVGDPIKARLRKDPRCE
jgi:hypothetical protein